MLRDRYDAPLTTRSPEACAGYVEGVDHILAATHGALEAMERAVRADPGFAVGHVGLARARMYAGDMPGARAAIGVARDLAAGVTAREASLIAVFDLLVQGGAAETRAAAFAHMAQFPRDVMVAQICTNIFGLIGLSGEPGRESLQLAFTSRLMDQVGAQDWWLLSVHGQALCEVGQLDAAMTMMERSLALNNANANASHFKAHTLYEQGDAATGRAYLAAWMAGYDRRAILHGHLSWHQALWALEQGDDAALWSIYDTAIAPEASSSLPVNVLTDAAALMYRAEIAGLPVAPARWQRLSDYAAQFFPNPGMSFADMHSALSHAMAGQGARLARLAEAERGFAADLVRPVAQAWGLIARQDWEGALAALAPVMADHARIGGSRAQRDLLELTWVNLLLKSDRTDEARRALASRRPVIATHAPVAGLV